MLAKYAMPPYWCFFCDLQNEQGRCSVQFSIVYVRHQAGKKLCGGFHDLPCLEYAKLLVNEYKGGIPHLSVGTEVLGPR